MYALNRSCSLKIKISTRNVPSSSDSPENHFFSFSEIFTIHRDRDFHALSEYVLNFLMTRFCIKKKEKISENEKNNLKE
jgi:hypothetical protein